jgi:hypothetical protein
MVNKEAKMEFLKWTLKESLFHYSILLLMFCITLFWEEGSDITIARTAIALIATVLVFGKYRYWKRLKRNGYL